MPNAKPIRIICTHSVESCKVKSAGAAKAAEQNTYERFQRNRRTLGDMLVAAVSRDYADEEQRSPEGD